MRLQVEFNAEMAVAVAKYFESTGMTMAAVSMWRGLCTSAPYDEGARHKLAEMLARTLPDLREVGTVVRSRELLNLIGQSFPTPALSGAYFDNLEQLLATQVKRDRPGEIVLGVGTGRSGSTTLCAAVATVPDSCATHENPPLISWKPAEEHYRFHVERFRRLADYYALVFDISHSWLNVLPRFLHEFPRGKVIGLVRDTQPCVESFLNVKGRGTGSINHWAAPDSDIWTTTLGDPSYPTYPLNPKSVIDPEAMKTAQITRYVIQYNETLRSLAAAHPERFLLIRTEDLNQRATADRLSTFLQFPLAMPSTALNAGHADDSNEMMFRL